MNAEDIQAEANDALGIISRQRNMALHEAAMQETRAMKAERALENETNRIAGLLKQIEELTNRIAGLLKQIEELTPKDPIPQVLNGKASECPLPPS